MDEAQIIIGLKAKDTAAFHNLFKRLHPQLCFFAEKIVKDEWEADNIVMNALEKFWQRGAQDFDTFVQVRKFVFTMVRNEAFNHLRKLKSEANHKRLVLYTTPGWEQSAVEKSLYATEMVEALMREIEKLPEQCRATFKLVYLEMMPRPQVAERLKISPATVNVHCANAMKKLRQVFSDQELMLLLVLAGTCAN